MLYISRYKYKDFVGIVDTDDGVEEFVDYYSLYNLCCDLGLEIVGVRTSVSDNALQYVDGADVYQPRSTLKPIQTKAKLMKHVDVKLYNALITSVLWDYERLVEPVVIRLSDFGSKCADCLLSGNVHAGTHKITIVVDDKVDIGEGTFKLREDDDSYMGITGLGVALDVSEVTDFSAAKAIYNSFFFGSVPELERSIIDIENRKKKMMRYF